MIEEEMVLIADKVRPADQTVALTEAFSNGEITPAEYARLSSRMFEPRGDRSVLMSSLLASLRRRLSASFSSDEHPPRAIGARVKK